MPCLRPFRPALPIRLLAAGVMALVLGGAIPSPANAAAGPWVGDEHATVRLIAATDAVGDSATQSLGLEFRFAPGWHGYWRTPGEAGLPPEVTWDGSANLAAARLSWPIPERTELLGIATFAYSNRLVMPVTATLARPGQPLTVKARVDYLACADICVPYSADLSLDLPAGPAQPTAEAALLAEANETVPVPIDRSDLRVTAPQLVTDADGSAALHLTVSGPGTSRPGTEVAAEAIRDILVEGPSALMGGPPVHEGGGRYRIPLRGVAAGDIAAGALTVTVIAPFPYPNRAVELTLPAGSLPIVQGGSGLAALAGILGIAFLGGVILNLMPCVLPVLSLKLLGVARLGGADRRTARQSLLLTMAGIVVSFLVLATAAIGLRSAGVAVGWGMQFQQPLFLGLMIAITAGFALNLLGMFEVMLPYRWSAALAGQAAAPVPSGAPSRRDSFLSGAFATLLATPCSAPFVGTALSFALSRGPGEILAIFLAMALGMALPYWAIALMPATLRFLPRPGRWMLWLRRGLALLLLGTAVWLGTVLATVLAPPAPADRTQPSGWQVWQETAVAEAVAQGKIVFLDITADWCVTCRANKLAVLDRDPVATALTQPGVIAMRADWTRPDPQIADFLKRNGRYGIPFNAVYGPAAPQGILLPELLTPGAVMEALAAASGRTVPTR